jgi:hypothetical protein
MLLLLSTSYRVEDVLQEAAVRDDVAVQRRHWAIVNGGPSTCSNEG